jgi:ribosomal protein S18 acetylase RimI-like enzyme
MEKIYRLSQNEIPESIIRQCAELYCEVWKEPPWNEDFWEPEEAIADIKEQSKKLNAELVISLNQDNGQSFCTGFTWGYQVTIDELRSISTSTDLDELFRSHRSVYYADELGVEIESRRKGAGLLLSELLLDQFQKSGAECVVLRTDEKAVAARNLYRKIGFQEIPVRDGKYPTRTYWLKKFK